MKVAIGKFAKESIEAHLGVDVAAGARTAMLRYADRLDSDEAPSPLPEFLREDLSPGEECSFELELEAKTQAALQREAERQMAPLDQIASQAVLAYLAELDEVGAVCRASGPGE